MALKTTIDCGLCNLRPWRLTDCDSLLEHANNRNVWRNLRDRFPHPYDSAAAAAWLEKATADPPPEGAWAIDVGGLAVGGLGIERQTDIARGSGEIGYWLGEAFWGRGIATAAVRGATAHALEQPDLWRVFAHVFPWNPASRRVLEKAGFQLEGILRRSAIKDGTVIDELMYAAVRDPGLPYLAAT